MKWYIRARIIRSVDQWNMAQLSPSITRPLCMQTLSKRTLPWTLERSSLELLPSIDRRAPFFHPWKGWPFCATRLFSCLPSSLQSHPLSSPVKIYDWIAVEKRRKRSWLQPAVIWRWCRVCSAVKYDQSHEIREIQQQQMKKTACDHHRQFGKRREYTKRRKELLIDFGAAADMAVFILFFPLSFPLFTVLWFSRIVLVLSPFSLHHMSGDWRQVSLRHSASLRGRKTKCAWKCLLNIRIVNGLKFQLFFYEYTKGRSWSWCERRRRRKDEVLSDSAK